MIVIDASVATKWYLPEAGSQAAVELQESPEQLIAPDLIRLEFAGSITRRVRAEKGKERLSPKEALSQCAGWFQRLHQATVISLIPEGDLIERALKLSVEVRHNLQDCMYLAAANNLEAALITADWVFHTKASKFYKGISMLPGCEPN